MKKINLIKTFLVFALFQSAPLIAEPEIGKPAPEFTLLDQNGTEHNLSQYRGKTIVLEWINPECPFVIRHYKSKTMTTLAEVYSSKEVVWLAIDSSHFVKPEESQAWIKANAMKYPILQDPEGKVGRMYEAKTTPHMFVIDKEGVLQYKGAIDNDSWGRKSVSELENYVEGSLKSLLAGETPSTSETKPYGCSVKYQ